MSYTKAIETVVSGMSLTISAPATLEEAINHGVDSQRLVDSAVAYYQYHVLNSRIRPSISAFLNANSGISRLTKPGATEGKTLWAETDEVYAARVASAVGPEKWAELENEARAKLKREGLDTISFLTAPRGSGVPKELKPYVVEAQKRFTSNGADWFSNVVAKYNAEVEALDDEGKPTDEAILVIAKVLKKRAEEAAL